MSSVVAVVAAAAAWGGRGVDPAGAGVLVAGRIEGDCVFLQ